ncbi:hypothetical protein [Micromonospora sp. NPDC049102]
MPFAVKDNIDVAGMPRTRSGATPCSAATPSSRTCSTWPR